MLHRRMDISVVWSSDAKNNEKSEQMIDEHTDIHMETHEN